MVKATELLKTFELIIRAKQAGGNTMQLKTMIQATSAVNAKRLGEAQYGKGSVVGNPREVKLK